MKNQLTETHNCFLLFHIDLRPAGTLLDGRLLLMEGAKIRERFVATSGAPQWQQRGDYDETGRGPIPRPDIVGIESYAVETAPHWVPDVPGIEGEFYEIFPTQVEIPGSGTRSHFGIHRDANAPGSAGCIVLPQVLTGLRATSPLIPRHKKGPMWGHESCGLDRLANGYYTLCR